MERTFDELHAYADYLVAIVKTGETVASRDAEEELLLTVAALTRICCKPLPPLQQAWDFGTRAPAYRR